MIPRLEEDAFRCKTLEKRRYFEFPSDGFHDGNSLVSATFFTERERILHGMHSSPAVRESKM